MESVGNFLDKLVVAINDMHILKIQVERMILERDATIRKECADRAVEWAMTTLGPLIMNSETRDELHAEIMGQED